MKIKSALVLVTLSAIGSVSAMEKKQVKKPQPQKKELQRKPSAEKIKVTETLIPQKEYKQMSDQLSKLKPSVNDYFMLENIQHQAAQQAYEVLKQEAKPSGKLTQQQTKDLQSYIKSEVDKNIDAIINDIFPASTIRDSNTIKNIAKNCITKFPKIELGDFETQLLESFNVHPKNHMNRFGGPEEGYKRGTIAKAYFAAQKAVQTRTI